MAVVVMMIIGLLATTLLLQSQGALSASDRAADQTMAAAGAERGIAEAIALIDNGQRGDFSGGGDLATGTYRFEAEQLDTTTYAIYSEATIEGATQAVVISLGGELEAATDFALLTRRGILSDENQGTIDGAVATTGEIRFRGTAPGTSQVLLGPTATCDGCPNPITAPDLPIPEPAAPTGSTRFCPLWFSGTIDGRNGAPFYCWVWFLPVRFTSTTTIINPPLVVHVHDSVRVDLDGSTINSGGSPEDFILNVVSDSSSPSFTLDGATITGTINTPGRDITTTGFDLTGQLTADSLIIDPNATVNISHPGGSTGTVSNWQVTGWRDVAAR